VALKCLRSDLIERPGFVSALRRTCKIWAESEDPAVPRFKELICRSDQIIVVRELLAGADLGALLASAPLRPEALENLLASLLSALAWLHRDGRVHGRVKPGNIFLCEDGRILWLDMAIAQAVSQARFDWGTIRDLTWTAPECCRPGRDHVGPQADVYSLGLVVWTLAMGTVPCPSAFPRVQLRWHLLEGPAPLTDLPPWLAQFIAKMSAASPADRFADGRLALAEFNRARESRTMKPVATRARRLPGWARRPDLASMVADHMGGLGRVLYTALLVAALGFFIAGLLATAKVVQSKGRWKVPIVSDWGEADEDGR
jgi:serine/threonine protein kinase